ncbi:hypothetical protein [Clostridium paraputrificum]|uniref:hypothetical protein n=1 Tax=Clostridium paraputrificum TaxID=29363 RepID=UPI0004057FE3|nr:hypothetical protein [Clostridium paraputrificum]DAU71238.1 MAG TPA: hypothetical protein [Caudoviricetes sp.]
MTLEEAIEHAKSQAIKLGCTECGKEHEQLAEWLKELKEYKKQVFKLGDIVYWYDDDYRYFESAIKNISILSDGTYEYSTQDIDFVTEDIGNWVFENEFLRNEHFQI